MAVEHLQRAAGQHGQRRLGEDGQPIGRGGSTAQQLLETIGQRAAALDTSRTERWDVDDGQARGVGLTQHDVDHGRQHAGQRLAQVALGDRSIAQRAGGVGDDRVEGVKDQLLLAGEEPVQGCGRDAGRGGQLIDARAGVALGAQKLDDRLVQPGSVRGADLVF